MIEEALKEAKCSQQREKQVTQPATIQQVAPQPVSQPAARQPPVLPSVTPHPVVSQPLTTRQISTAAPRRGNLKKELDKEKVRVDQNDPDVFNLRRKLYVC